MGERFAIMGASPSLFTSKKVQAERKAREEAERRAQIHEEAARALQVELEVTREQLKIMKQELQGSRGGDGVRFRQFHQANAPSPTIMTVFHVYAMTALSA